MRPTPNRSTLGVALLCGALVAGCSGPQSTESDDTVQMKRQAVDEIEEERAEKARRPIAEPDQPGDEEELIVEMFELRPGQPARAESGLEIHLVSGAPNWAFDLDHHGRKTKAQYTGKPLYIEGYAYGHLYVISQLGDVVQVTLRAAASDEALTENQAFEAARRERATRLGCDGAREETSVQTNGTAVLRVLDANGAESCRIVVGRYTQQIVDY